MITSRHNTFGCWLFFGITIFFLALGFGEILSHYSIIQTHKFIKLDNKSFYTASAMLFSFGFLFLFFTATFIKKISIDPLSDTITFRNIITRQKKIYNFSDFDGFADTYLTHRISSYKTIALVKDKIVLRYIDCFWVSNYDQLRLALKSMKCLGTFNFGSWKQLKLLLRQPVIE